LFVLLIVFAISGYNMHRETDAATNVNPNQATKANRLIYPKDLVYKGAFRLPGGSNGSNWEYSGYAMAYYPEGDPNGAADGYSGSIFAIGHDHQQFVSEISIPGPVISRTKNLNELNTARTLQGFKNIRGSMFGNLDIPRAGLAYLPPQDSQKTGKLYFAWGQHFQEFEASHGWCELNLSNPKPAGPWHFDGFTNYATNDYLFEIPKDWANTYTGGQLLASGRFRDGNWGGQGPALFAYAPWKDGNPPPPNATLKTITALLLYGIQRPGMNEIEITSIRDSSEKDTLLNYTDLIPAHMRDRPVRGKTGDQAFPAYLPVGDDRRIERGIGGRAGRRPARPGQNDRRPPSKSAFSTRYRGGCPQKGPQ
jgi:hypothetical protein